MLLKIQQNLILPKCYNHSTIGEGSRDSGFLIQSMEGLDKYKRLTTFHFIHAIFVNDLKI